jgi:hypothetical protein
MLMPDTLSRGDLWNPSHLDLELWLDGTDATTMSFSSPGVIQEWRDKSGNDRHVVAAAGTPEFRGRIFYPGGVVSLKNGDKLYGTSGVMSLPSVTVFIASFVELGADVWGGAYQQDYERVLCGMRNAGNTQWAWGFGHWSQVTWDEYNPRSSGCGLWINNNRYSPPTGSYLDTNAVSITTISTYCGQMWRNQYSLDPAGNGNGQIMRAPVSVETTGLGNIGYSSPFWFQVGDTWFAGSVGEIIVLNGHYGTHDPVRAKIEAYLANKFAQGSNYIEYGALLILM